MPEQLYLLHNGTAITKKKDEEEEEEEKKKKSVEP